MATDSTKLEKLGGNIFNAAKDSLGNKFGAVKIYMKAESEKLAITLRMITESYLAGELSKAEAKILLNQQKAASMAVLTAAEGMTAVAVQGAINAALKVVKDTVNTAIGFPLL